jgi:4-alpha-glucanotransferase
MSHSIRFLFVLHDHQPIGNFDNVFEQAYQDSYRPFLDVFERYPRLKMALHTSGPLMEWLDVHHPEYLERLARLVAAGRIEIIGGPFYEPILSMIPSRDRVGQILCYRRWLEDRLQARIRGMWMPERVWEQSMTRDLAAAGVEYTLLDDFHFKNAGLTESQLNGYYLTEDDGHLLAVFPDSEPLRYLIPFGSPQEVIDHLGRIHQAEPGAIALFGDDGEKLGAWPETKKHVYDNGWLVRFFDLLMAHESWIQTTTPSEVLDTVPPIGKIYLPEGSYREMTEWVLPSEQLSEYVHVRRELEHDPRWPRIARFVRGGFWRNFKVKYPETGDMYARMMMVSGRLHSLVEGNGSPSGMPDGFAAGGDRIINQELVEQARKALYRGQCNCSYWHGAFGGVYLPHLRNAVYAQLIAADNLLDRATGRTEPWVSIAADDFNLDGRQEVQLASNRLLALLAPARGGHLYELDVRSICHNLLATLTRRPEAYHRKVLAGTEGFNDVAGVSDKVIFKQSGLDARLQYDSYPRKSLVDHFYDAQVSLAALARGEATERGDFLNRQYEARLRRNPNRMQVQLAAQGTAGDLPVRITKAVTLEAGGASLSIAYLLEGLVPSEPLHFGVEFNFAGLPAGADDRFFYNGNRQRLGQLGTQLDLNDAMKLGLVDEWLGIDVSLEISRPSGIWTFPVESVSQSEGGFELVHQSVVVQPHWIVQPDADGRWSVTIHLTLDTTLAESRQETSALAVST